MARSDPTIISADLPTEAPPSNTFAVEVEVEQGGGDPWGSDGDCVTSGLDVTGWKTPVELVVDGDVVDDVELCAATGHSKTATLSTSIQSTGEHDLAVKTYSIGGNAYDLQGPELRLNDEIRQTITVSGDASDPSRPSTSDRLLSFLTDAADAVGTSVNTLALSIVAAAAVVLLI